MGSYILRRLLLVIPTLLGVMLVNFILIQFVPGGPIDQVLAQLEGEGDVFAGISGGGSEAIGDNEFESQGARGLPPQYLDSLRVEFRFARIVCEDGFTGEPDLDEDACVVEDIPVAEQFVIMMWDYLRFDFGESYFRSIGVLELVQEKLPVSISLGLWSTLIAYAVSIPLGIRKAVRDGTTFDSVTSGIIIVAYAIPGFLFAIMLLIVFAGGRYLQWFPLRGLTSDGFEDMNFIQQIGDYFWHIALPVLASTISAFATLTLLTKNSFLDEIKKQYVMTAKAKGLPERRVLYGHVFRNAMLIVIAGFPAVFVGVFFGGSIIIETIFSLDGLGRLGFEAAVSRDYSVMFGTLYVFGLIGLGVGIISDLMYVWIDPRIDFEKREG
ncbi:ABC transporter permease subunit [Rhodobacteraceae bacterium M385]|nr:ABC transporter permease subunit [Rhodobacteraceae bacterium M385]